MSRYVREGEGRILVPEQPHQEPVTSGPDEYHLWQGDQQGRVLTGTQVVPQMGTLFQLTRLWGIPQNHLQSLYTLTLLHPQN